MNYTANMAELSKALKDLNKELDNPKNSAINPFFKSKYAPLNDILSYIRPLMAEHGLSIVQNTLTQNEAIGIQTMIIHESGQFIQSDIMFIKTDKDTAQGQGSAITYGRRYQLSAMLSIASEDDDDGNSASKQPENKPESKHTPAALKNPKGEIELQKGDHVKIMQELDKVKNEKQLKFYYDKRAKFTWTTEEITEQDKFVEQLKAQWTEATA